MEAVKPVKKPKVIILYNNKDITKNISSYIQSVTYTDYEKDQSDELAITLNDYDGYFQNDWYPDKGDKISAYIGYEGEKLLNCGTFTIDEPELNIETEGDIFTIRALAASINQNTREKNVLSYRNKTLVDIAKQIGKKHGYTVAEASQNNSGGQTNAGKEGKNAGFIKIPYAAQYNETDLAFLKRLAASYGYIFKLTDTVITFIPAEDLENSKSILSISRKDIERGTFRDAATKTFTACSAKYISPKTGKLVTYTARSNKTGLKRETLKLDGKYATKAQAKAATEAALRRGSKAVTANIDFKSGQIKALAGVNIEADMKNRFSGKYHITQSTHTVTPEDYKTSVECERL